MPRTLQRQRERALMLSARTCLTTRVYAGPVGYIAPQGTEILVVNMRNVVHAEGTHPSASEEPASTFSPPARRRPSGRHTACSCFPILKG